MFAFLSVLAILYAFACVGYCSVHCFCQLSEWLIQFAATLHRWTHKAKPSNSIISYSQWMADFEVRR